MKTQNLTLIVVLLSVFAPGLLLPGVGLASCRAQTCPYTPATNPDNSPQTNPNNSPNSPDPVSYTRGVFTFSVTDLKEPGVTPIVFTRYYDSSLSYDGPVGNNWDFSFNRYLTFASGTLYYHTGRGYKIPLTYTTGGGSILAQSTGSEYYTVTYNSSSSQFTVNDAHGNQDVFNSKGFLVETLDRNGNQLAYTHDTNGNLLSIQDPVHGQSITITLDSHYRISAITDSFGRTVGYTYDTNYNLTKVTSPPTSSFPSGTTLGYTYDSDNRMVTKVDGLGNTLVTNTYGAVGGASEFRVVSQVFQGNTQTFSYNDTAQETTYTDSKGFVTNYYWDASGDVLKQIVHTAGIHTGAPSTYETDYTYDSLFRKTKETYPNGNSTSWTYDSYNNVLTVTAAMASGSVVNSSEGTQVLSATTTYTYEPRFNQVASVTDPNGKVTTYGYGTASSNPPGNLLSITYPTTSAGTATESFTYNSLGQILTHTTADGAVAQNTYNASTGYLTQTVGDYGTGKLNATTQLTYDSYGHVATIKDANSHTSTIITNALDQVTEVDGASSEVEQKAYDANGNLLTDKKQAPSSQWEEMQNIYNAYQQVTAVRQYTSATAYLETDYAYDANGNRTTVTDPLGHTTTTAYDERNKAYQVTDPLSHTVKYDFDGNGNTNKLTDELSHITTYAFDGLDRLEQKTFPDSSYQTWKFDAVGNVTGLRTTAGNTITQTYDTRNCMLTQVYGTSTITNTYDLMNRLHTATEGGAALTYAYDHLGRNTSFTDQAGHTSTYSYDLVGNRTSTAYPTGVTVNRAHDASNRVTTLKDGGSTTQATYSYDILDRPTSLALANSTTVTYTFDLVNRLTNVQNTLASGNRNYSYVYNSAGLRTSETEPRGTLGYGYDNRNELTSITEPTGSPFAGQSFGYDAGFNRASWTLGSTTTNYTVNNLNQYATVSGSTAPTWNGDGGMASFAGNTYSYDALGRLTKVSNSIGIYVFSYDPLGRRVKKVDENPSGGVLSTYSYHYDGSEIAVEYQPSTTWTYYLGLGIDQPVMRISGTTKQWYYASSLGSISAVADNSGNLLEAYEYNAQGQFQVTNASGTVQMGTQIGNSILYTGRSYDAETGNYFYRARYYNPTLGRFISRDPLSGAEFSQGTNLYAYCGNNYLNLTDPTGKSYAGFWSGVGVGAAVTPGGAEIGGVIGGLIGTLIEPGGGTALGAAIGAWAGGLAAGTYGAWVTQAIVDETPPATNPADGNFGFTPSTDPANGNWDPTAPGGGGDPAAGNWDPTLPGGGGDPGSDGNGFVASSDPGDDGNWFSPSSNPGS